MRSYTRGFKNAQKNLNAIEKKNKHSNAQKIGCHTLGETEATHVKNSEIYLVFAFKLPVNK